MNIPVVKPPRLPSYSAPLPTQPVEKKEAPAKPFEIIFREAEDSLGLSKLDEVKESLLSLSEAITSDVANDKESLSSVLKGISDSTKAIEKALKDVSATIERVELVKDDPIAPTIEAIKASGDRIVNSILALGLKIEAIEASDDSEQEPPEVEDEVVSEAINRYSDGRVKSVEYRFSSGKVMTETITRDVSGAVTGVVRTNA